MKIGILKKELVNYESEFEFFSKVIENYEKEFENLKKPHGKNMEQPSENILKIVKLLQHKTQRTTLIFNDMLTLCQKEISSDQNKSQQNTFIFTQLLDEFSLYFDSVLKKAKNLHLRIQNLKQKAFGTYDPKYKRNTYEQKISVEKDKVFKYDNNLQKKRGLTNLEGILLNYQN
jgi:hypothetical protein